LFNSIVYDAREYPIPKENTLSSSISNRILCGKHDKHVYLMILFLIFYFFDKDWADKSPSFHSEIPGLRLFSPIPEATH